jgi:hypothetical protein
VKLGSRAEGSFVIICPKWWTIQSSLPSLLGLCSRPMQQSFILRFCSKQGYVSFRISSTREFNFVTRFRIIQFLSSGFSKEIFKFRHSVLIFQSSSLFMCWPNSLTYQQENQHQKKKKKNSTRIYARKEHKDNAVNLIIIVIVIIIIIIVIQSNL